MTHRRNLIWLIAAVVLCVFVLSLSALAATPTSGVCGANVQWSLSDSGVLTLSGSGAMSDYPEDSPPWYSHRSKITKVVVSSGVTELGDYAFHNCGSISSVSLPSGLTRIGENAFSNCGSLTAISLPDSLTTIESNAFDSTGLTSLSLPSSVTTLGQSAFKNCAALAKVSIPASVTEMKEFVFADCPKLTSAGPTGSGCSIEFGWTTAVPNFAFSYCGSLTSLTLPSTLTSIGHSAFAFTSISAVSIPSSVSSIRNGAFACTNLSSVSLPGALSSVAGDTFYGCSSLSTVTIPASVKTIGYGAFAECTALASVRYAGTAAQWSAIEISDGNEPLLNADRICGWVSLSTPSFSISCRASDGKPSLSWKAVSGAAKYEVWRAYSKNGTYYKMGTTSGTTYTNTSAKAGTTYYYKIRAVAANGQYSSFSSVKNMTCDCAQPVFTISCRASDGKPSLSWTAVDGAVNYEIWRSTSKNGTYYKMYTTSGTTYTNTSAKAGTTYYYKIYAVGSSSYSKSAASTVKNMTCDCARPSVSVALNASGKPRLTWPAVDGAVKYEIWRSTSSGGSYTKLYTTTNTYFNNTSAVSGTTYFYKVRAIGTSSYATSAFSSIVSAQSK